MVDSVSLPFLADAVIDFTEELIGARFTIENPNAHLLLRLRHVVFHVIGVFDVILSPLGFPGGSGQD